MISVWNFNNTACTVCGGFVLLMAVIAPWYSVISGLDLHMYADFVIEISWFLSTYRGFQKYMSRVRGFLAHPDCKLLDLEFQRSWQSGSDECAASPECVYQYKSTLIARWALFALLASVIVGLPCLQMRIYKNLHHTKEVSGFEEECTARQKTDKRVNKTSETLRAEVVETEESTEENKESNYFTKCLLFYDQSTEEINDSSSYESSDSCEIGSFSSTNSVEIGGSRDQLLNEGNCDKKQTVENNNVDCESFVSSSSQGGGVNLPTLNGHYAWEKECCSTQSKSKLEPGRSDSGIENNRPTTYSPCENENIDVMEAQHLSTKNANSQKREQHNSGRVFQEANDLPLNIKNTDQIENSPKECSINKTVNHCKEGDKEGNDILMCVSKNNESNSSPDDVSMAVELENSKSVFARVDATPSCVVRSNATKNLCITELLDGETTQSKQYRSRASGELSSAGHSHKELNSQNDCFMNQNENSGLPFLTNQSNMPSSVGESTDATNHQERDMNHYTLVAPKESDKQSHTAVRDKCAMPQHNGGGSIDHKIDQTDMFIGENMDNSRPVLQNKNSRTEAIKNASAIKDEDIYNQNEICDKKGPYPQNKVGEKCGSRVIRGNVMNSADGQRKEDTNPLCDISEGENRHRSVISKRNSMHSRFCDSDKNCPGNVTFMEKNENNYRPGATNQNDIDEHSEICSTSKYIRAEIHAGGSTSAINSHNNVCVRAKMNSFRSDFARGSGNHLRVGDGTADTNCQTDRSTVEEVNNSDTVARASSLHPMSISLQNLNKARTAFFQCMSTSSAGDNTSGNRSMSGHHMDPRMKLLGGLGICKTQSSPGPQERMVKLVSNLPKPGNKTNPLTTSTDDTPET